MMRIYVSEEDRWKNKPLHEALVEAMRANDMPGSRSIEASSAMAPPACRQGKATIRVHHGSIMRSS